MAIASEQEDMLPEQLVGSGAGPLGASRRVCVALLSVTVAVGVLTLFVLAPGRRGEELIDTQAVADLAQLGKWHYLNHGKGVPVRCGAPGKIQCASNDGKHCLWGTFGKHGNYAAVSGVRARKPLEVSCPAWPPADGSDPCVRLSCPPAKKEKWYYLPSGQGTPVRCSASGKLECASYDGKHCHWGKYSKRRSYKLMTDVHSRHPVEVSCPGWPAEDGTNACEELSCKPELKMTSQCNKTIHELVERWRVESVPVFDKTAKCPEKGMKCFLHWKWESLYPGRDGSNFVRCLPGQKGCEEWCFPGGEKCGTRILRNEIYSAVRKLGGKAPDPTWCHEEE